MKYFVKQIGEKDCSFACLKMLLAIVYHNKKFLLYPQNDVDRTYSLEDIINFAAREGVSLYGFRFKKKEDILKQVALPVLTPIKSGNMLHMVLIKKVKKNKLLIYDPAKEPLWVDYDDFETVWNGECLEVTEVRGSLFKEKKMNFVPFPYKIVVPLFQLLSFGFLITALFFVNDDYSFFIPLCFLLAFIIFEFVYRSLLISEMKAFDKKILQNFDIRDANKLRSKYIEMNNFKVLLVGNPIQVINSFVILGFGIAILAINSYLNVINLAIVFVVTILMYFIEKRFFQSTKTNINSYENSVLNIKGYDYDDLKDKIDELHKRTYNYVNFTNVQKLIQIFLIIVICLIYCAFTNNISLNFLLFHTFMYYYLTQNIVKLLDVAFSSSEKSYYLSLYQYYAKN